jgi:hypothetical protein
MAISVNSPGVHRQKSEFAEDMRIVLMVLLWSRRNPDVRKCDSDHPFQYPGFLPPNLSE